VGEVFPGVVLSPTPGGLGVQLLETGMEGFVPMRELKDDFYEYDPDRFALVGRRSGRVWGIGEELDVMVAAADIDRCDVVLGLAGGGGPATRRLQRQERDEGNRFGRERRPPPADGQRPGKQSKRQERLSKQEQKREERKRRRDERQRRGK
jgi:ribonuclease R